MSQAAISVQANKLPSSPRGLMYFGFVLTGIVTTLIGPILPLLSQKWSLSDSQSGRFFLAEFISSTTATIASGWVLRQRGGFRIALTAGYFCMAAGTATIMLVPWPMCLVSAAVAGVGVGLVIPATNLEVAQTSERRASDLNVLNACWALGAILYPPLVGLALRYISVAWLMLFLGAMLVGMTMVVAFKTDRGLRSHAQEDGTRAVKLSFTVFALMFFLYCGTENAISGWIAAYTQRVSIGGEVWVATPAIFWLALFLGRLLAPKILNMAPEFWTCGAALGTALVGAALIAGAWPVRVLFMGAAISGLGLSMVYPLFISFATKSVDARLMGFVFASAGIGAASVPWLMGMASSRSGDLRVAMQTPIWGILMMLGLLVFAKRLVWKSV